MIGVDASMMVYNEDRTVMAMIDSGASGKCTRTFSIPGTSKDTKCRNGNNWCGT